MEKRDVEAGCRLQVGCHAKQNGTEASKQCGAGPAKSRQVEQTTSQLPAKWTDETAAAAAAAVVAVKEESEGGERREVVGGRVLASLRVGRSRPAPNGFRVSSLSGRLEPVS